MIQENEVEAFLTKNGLRLLGMYLSSQESNLSKKKDHLKIRAVQEIFWKALRSLTNFNQQQIEKMGKRLETEFNELIFKLQIFYEQIKLDMNQNSALEMKNSFELINTPNLKIMKNEEIPSKKDGKLQNIIFMHISSRILSKIGKLNTLKQLCISIFNQMAENKDKENRKSNSEKRIVKRLFGRQSRRNINRLSKMIQKGEVQKRSLHNSLKEEACSICGMDECLEDDDIFVYCDSCSVMVHKNCMKLKQSDLAGKKWDCPNCLRKQKRSKNYNFIFEQIKDFQELKLLCGKKKKTGEAKIPLNQVIRDIFSKKEFCCLLCGKSKGITVGIHQMNDFYIHLSCAYWLPEIKVSDKMMVSLPFNTTGFYSSVDPWSVDKVIYPGSKIFFLNGLGIIEKRLKNIFTSSDYKPQLSELVKVVREYFKNPFEPIENIVIPKRGEAEDTNSIKRKPVKRPIGIKCNCLFKPPYYENFWFILRRLITNFYIKERSKEYKKLLHIIKGFYPILFGKFHKSRSPKGTCSNCHYLLSKKCKVCCNSLGRMLKCFESKCKTRMHIECAKRVFCEVVPEGSASNDFIIFCPEHSKSPVLRRKEALQRKMFPKILEIANSFKETQMKIECIKKQMERENTYHIFEDWILQKNNNNCFENESVELINETKSEISSNFDNSKRIRKNKFEKIYEDKKLTLLNKMEKNLLNSTSYWFLKFKKPKLQKSKIVINLIKRNDEHFILNNFSFEK